MPYKNLRLTNLTRSSVLKFNLQHCDASNGERAEYLVKPVLVILKCCIIYLLFLSQHLISTAWNLMSLDVPMI